MNKPDYLGIDIGGTSAKYALITQRGDIGEKGSFPTGRSCALEEFLGQLLRVIQEAAATGIKGVGISCLGIIDPTQGIILGGVENMPYLKGLPLVQHIKDRCPDLAVSVCNDARAAALGEHWKGCAQAYKSFVCIVLGTGIGSAVVLNGEVWEGAHFRAGELGYLDFQSNDSPYLEKRISTSAVTAQASALLGMPIDGFALFKLAAQGNPVCTNLLDQWIHQLARVAASLIVLLDVECIILGGGVSREREMILPKLREYTNKYLPAEMRNQTVMETARRANDANLLGAVAYLRKFTQNGSRQRFRQAMHIQQSSLNHTG